MGGRPHVPKLEIKKKHFSPLPTNLKSLLFSRCLPIFGSWDCTERYVPDCEDAYVGAEGKISIKKDICEIYLKF